MNKLWKYLLSGLFLISIATLVIDYIQEPVSVRKYREQRNDLQFIALSKGQTRYSLNEKGSEELAVFIHGGGIIGSEIFKKNIGWLNKKGVSTLTYDQYGRGYSDKPRIDYSSDDLVRQFEELLDSLDLRDKKINLVALSMGSIIAWKFLKTNPSNVKKVIFLSPSLFSGFSPNLVLKVPVLNYLLMTWYWKPQYIRKRIKEFYDPDQFSEYSVLLDFFSGFRGFKRVYLSTWLGIISENCMVDEVEPGYLDDIYLIFGSNDPYLNINSKEQISMIFRDAPIYVVNNSGHMPNYEQPEQVNQLLIDLLKEN